MVKRMFEINRAPVTTRFVAILVVGGIAVSAEPHREWLDPQGISGKLLICGGGDLPERIKFTSLRPLQILKANTSFAR